MKKLLPWVRIASSALSGVGPIEMSLTICRERAGSDAYPAQGFSEKDGGKTELAIDCMSMANSVQFGKDWIVRRLVRNSS